jgi:hypothetical protein
MKEEIKKIAKYTTNILGMITAILIGLNAVEGITIPHCTQIVEVVAVFQGIIGTYLISGKLWSDK